MYNTGDNIKKINITPEFAKSLLENNTHNRRLREGAVEKYARDMLLDNWNTDVVDPICQNKYLKPLAINIYAMHLATQRKSITLLRMQ